MCSWQKTVVDECISVPGRIFHRFVTSNNCSEKMLWLSDLLINPVPVYDSNTCFRLHITAVNQYILFSNIILPHSCIDKSVVQEILFQSMTATCFRLNVSAINQYILFSNIILPRRCIDKSVVQEILFQSMTATCFRLHVSAVNQYILFSNIILSHMSIDKWIVQEILFQSLTATCA